MIKAFELLSLSLEIASSIASCLGIDTICDKLNNMIKVRIDESN